MISDASLAQLFQSEYAGTRSLEQAVRAVRRTVEAHIAEETRRRFLVRVTRGVDGAPVGLEQLARICENAAEVSSIGLEDFLDSNRRECLHARWVAAAVLRHLGASYPQIARALQMTDHTRAIDAVRKVDATPWLAERRDQVLAEEKAP
jgi:chromosomal replication initiation ATPase DnaA